MSLVRNGIYDNGQARLQGPGDLLCTNEVVLANTTVGTTPITAQMISTGLLKRSGSAGAYADAFPSSTDLIAGLLSNYYQGGGSYGGSVGIANDTSFRFRIINTVAFTNTPTIGAGGTLVGTTAMAASSWKDYLVTIKNGTPASVTSGNTTNTSAVVTNVPLAQLQALTQGMLVTGTGIPAATTILSIQPGVGFTMSANATATNAGVAITAAPVYTVESLGGGTL